MSQEQPRPVAIVTGGGSGIGRATALKFHDAGFSTVIADINVDAAADTLSAIGSGDTAMTAHVDVRREGDVAKMITAAVDTFGRLDVLVNNAGVGGAFGSVTEIDADDWDFTFEVLTRGAFLGIKHAVPAMTMGGCIVNVASIAAYSGSLGSIAYTSAKAAVLGMTRAAAVELAARRIRVNAVCPGVIRTPLLESGASKELDTLLPLAQPWPEWGQPADIAAAVVFLASPDASFITGEALTVDGGLVAAGPGEDFLAHLGSDPRTRGLAGVNRGSTGERSIVRRRTPQ